MLHIHDLSLSFGSKNVLNDFNFTLEEGEIICLLGYSGCGKTTILRAIAGFEQPERGTIVLANNILSNQKIFLPAHLRQVGMVFQDYALFPHLTIFENIAFGLNQFNQTERNHRVNELLALTNLTELRNQYPHQLSGGQQQRVALARALAPKPRLILMDEPFSNLDTELRNRLAKDVRNLLKSQNMTAIIVTHDANEAFAIADKIGIMNAGQLQQLDTPQNLYTQPNSPLVAQFTGTCSFLSGKVSENGTIHTAIGEFAAPLEYPSGSHVQMLIRPDNITFDANSQLSAQLISSEFKGEYTVCILALNNGEQIIWHTSSIPQVPHNQLIPIRLTLTSPIFFNIVPN